MSYTLRALCYPGGKKYVLSMWYTYPLGNSDQCHLNFWSSSKFVKSNCYIVSLMMIAKKNKSAEFIWWEFFLCVETISKSLCHLCRHKAASCLYIIRYKYEIAHNIFIIFFVSIRNVGTIEILLIWISRIQNTWIYCSTRGSIAASRA